jgi:hypothetical protein
MNAYSKVCAPDRLGDPGAAGDPADDCPAPCRSSVAGVAAETQRRLNKIATHDKIGILTGIRAAQGFVIDAGSGTGG